MAMGSEKSADAKFVSRPPLTSLTWAKVVKETAIEIKLPAGVSYAASSSPD